jgi:hypothetical protein
MRHVAFTTDAEPAVATLADDGTILIDGLAQSLFDDYPYDPLARVRVDADRSTSGAEMNWVLEALTA